MKRPPTEPWVYRSLSGGVYDCRTKEEGRLEIVNGKLDKLLADEQQKSYKLSFELAHVRDQKDQAIALLRRLLPLADHSECCPAIQGPAGSQCTCEYGEAKRYLGSSNER